MGLTLEKGPVWPGTTYRCEVCKGNNDGKNDIVVENIVKRTCVHCLYVEVGPRESFMHINHTMLKVNLEKLKREGFLS